MIMNKNRQKELELPVFNAHSNTDRRDITKSQLKTNHDTPHSTPHPPPKTPHLIYSS